MKVLKFGGSSVGTPEAITRVMKIVESLESPSVVIVSAFRGITDQIIRTSEMACNRNEAYGHALEEIRLRHLAVVNQLIAKERRENVEQFVNKMMSEFKDLLYGIFLVGDLTPKTRDHLLSFGERLSSFIITNALTSAKCVDMRHFIRTDSQFGNAQVDFEVTNENIRRMLLTMQGTIIVPGFIAANENGDITTLGREDPTILQRSSPGQPMPKYWRSGPTSTDS